MTLLENIMAFFPKLDYNNSNLMNEYYTAYKYITSPYKDNYNYTTDYFDRLHYLRHKLHNEFDYSLLYTLNYVLGKNGSDILQDELSNYIKQLKKEQEQFELIQLAINIEQEELNKQLESMDLVETINTDKIESLFTKVILNDKKSDKKSNKNANKKYNNRIIYKNRYINK